MLEFISDFIWTWYLSPGYNIVNTLTYGIVLGLIIFRLIPRLKPLLGEVNRSFLFMIFPFILFGSTMRELVDQDMGLYAGNTEYPANYMLVSPGIFFTMFAIALTSIIIGKLVERLAGADYRITTGIIGCIIAGYNITLVASGITHPNNLWAVLGFFFMAAGIVYCIKRLANLRYLDFEGNLYIIFVHFFDASTTFVGVDLMGHVEKHVVPNLFIDLVGTSAVMFPLKLAVLLPALYMIDDELKDDTFARRFVKFVIVVLGMGPGLRNMTLLLMG